MQAEESALEVSATARGETVAPATGDAEETSRLAMSLFDDGFNCAESVVQALTRRDENARAVGQRMATGFGAGTARRGGVCGALHGCAMAVSFLLGRRDPHDAEGKEQVYAWSLSE